MTNLLSDQVLLVLTATAGVIVLLFQLHAHQRLREADPRLMCQTHRGLYQKMQIVPMPIQDDINPYRVQHSWGTSANSALVKESREPSAVPSLLPSASLGRQGVQASNKTAPADLTGAGAGLAQIGGQEFVAVVELGSTRHRSTGPELPHRCRPRG
jgi:hypothetical protein